MKFLSRRRRAVALYPMSLVFISLIFLVGPGMLYNNFTASGLAPAQVLGTAGVCGNFAPGAPIDVTCQGSVNAGCQAQPGQCTLSGNTVSFLNNQSPFTQLAKGNIFGLFGQITSNGNLNRGPFDANGGGQYYNVNCYFKNISPGSNNITQNAFWGQMHSCTQTGTDGINITTKANTVSFSNWNVNATIFSTTLPQLHVFDIGSNSTFTTTCSVQGYWFLTNQPEIGYSVAGCDFYNFGTSGYAPPDNPAKTPIWSFLLALPCSVVTGGISCKSSMVSGTSYHLNAFFQPEVWDTAFCPNTFPAGSPAQQLWYSSQQCVNEQTWYTTPHTAGGFSGSGTANFGLLTPFLTILAGLILFLIGLGINITAGGQILGSGTTFGAGVNRQGTKLAQILGLALIGYSVLYSEFSVWFTSGVLPNGFDGATGVVALIIGSLFFGGIMWQATQG